jgi:glycosyl transferase family 25
MQALAPNAGRCCFVINLDRSPDRLRAISGQLFAAGIAFRRFPAVDGRFVDLDKDRLFDRNAFEARHGKTPAQGEIACTLSHLGVMRAFLETGAESCLILEDDAIIEPGLDKLLDRLDGNRTAWDMVFLYGNHDAFPVRLARLDSAHDLVGYFARQSGSVAYLINRKAAKALVARLLPVKLPFDHDFTRAWEYGIRIRGVSPFPVSTGAHASDIGGRRGKFPWYRRMSAYMSRGAREARRACHYMFVDPIWWNALLYYLARDGAVPRVLRSRDMPYGAPLERSHSASGGRADGEALNDRHRLKTGTQS